MLKKYFIISLMALSLLLVPAVQVYAQTDLSQQIAGKSGYGTATSNTLSETVGKVIKILLGLLGIIFLALTVYAGFLWMTAQGEEDKISKAVGILKTSVIGLIIIIAAYSITYFVLANAFALTSFLGNNALAASNSQEAINQLNAAAGSSGANIAGSGPMDPRVIVAVIIRSLLQLIGIVFIVLIVYAGFLWMTAAGEEDKTSKAKKLIYDGVIGLAIILSAYAISYFIFRLLLGANANNGNPFGYGGTSNITNYGPNPGNYNTYNP